MNGNKCLMSLNKLEFSVLSLWWDPVLFCFYHIVIIYLLFFYKFIYFFYSFTVTTIMDKSLGHFCVSGAFSNSHRSSPSPYPTNNVGRVCPEFCRVSPLYRVGGERTTRKFRKGCTVLRGNQEMTEKYEYCSIVPRTFVQDCNWLIVPSKGIRIPESGKFSIVQSRILDLGIRNAAQGFPNPANDWNPESTFQWQRIRNPEAGIRNLKRKIQNPRLSWISLDGACKKIIASLWRENSSRDLRTELCTRV